MTLQRNRPKTVPMVPSKDQVDNSKHPTMPSCMFHKKQKQQPCDTEVRTSHHTD